MADNSLAGSYFFDDAFQVDAYRQLVRDQQPGQSTIDIMEWSMGSVSQIVKASPLTHNADNTQAATAMPISIDIDQLSKRPQPSLRVMLVIVQARR